MEWFLVLLVVGAVAAVLYYRTKKRLEAEQALRATRDKCVEQRLPMIEAGEPVPVPDDVNFRPKKGEVVYSALPAVHDRRLAQRGLGDAFCQPKVTKSVGRRAASRRYVQIPNGFP